MSSRYGAAKELFLRAAELDPGSRAAFLDEACGGDAALRARIEALLDAHDRPDDADAAPAFEAGQVFAGRYRIVALLGRGGMGAVYRADDLTLGVPVALKFVLGSTPEHVEALRNEVRLAREVSHPSVCRVYDVGESDGRHFVTMEFVEGEDLERQLRRLGRVPPAKVMEIARELCAGLAEAHARGVLHRDLKPANVLIDAAGRARITDFGIAIREGGGRGPLAGTPAYMAPEQLDPDGLVTERTDLYALGLVLSELLTGRRVCDAGSVPEARALHRSIRKQPPSRMVSEVDPRLERQILHALEEDPAGRPASARAMATALEGGPVARPSPVRALGRGHRIAAGAMVLVWGVCLVLHVVQGTAGRLAWPGLVVAPGLDAAGYPVFEQFQPGYADPGAGLARGDRIVRVGRRDMHGAPLFYVAAAALAEADASLRVALETERDGVARASILQLRPLPSPWWALLPAAGSWVLISIWVLLRAPEVRAARTMFFAGTSASTAFLWFQGGPVALGYANLAVLLVFGGVLSVPLLVRCAALLPVDPRHPAPPAPRWPWIFAPLYAVALVSYAAGVPLSPAAARVVFPVVIAAAVGAGIGVLARNYARSTPVGRRQLRWILFGAVVPFPLIAGAYVVASVWPEQRWPILLALWSTVATPACIYVAIVRYNLFDIDRLISTTAATVASVALLAALGALLIPPAAALVAGATGLEPALARVGLALALVAVLVPAQGRLRPRIDRLFFRERFRADRGVEELLDLVGEQTRADALWELVGRRLVEIYRPRSCAIYAAEAGVFTPVFTDGSTAAPGFETGSALVRVLEDRSAPVVATRDGRAARGQDLTPFDLAALETLDASVVIPVRHGAELAAFVCLGPRSSGDVYTPVDRALLGALGRVASAQLLSAAGASSASS